MMTTGTDEYWAQHIRDAKRRTRECYEELRGDNNDDNDNDDALMWFALCESEMRPTQLAIAILLLSTGPPDDYVPSPDDTPDAGRYNQYTGVVRGEFVRVKIGTEQTDGDDFVYVATKESANAAEDGGYVSYSHDEVVLLQRVHAAAVAKPLGTMAISTPVHAKHLMERYISAFAAILNGEFAPASYPRVFRHPYTGDGNEWVLPLGRVKDTWAWWRVDDRDFVSMNGTDLSNDAHIVAAMRALHELYTKRSQR